MGERDRDLEIFRQEALEHRARSRRQGDLLRISPAWMRHTWWLLLALTATGAVYLWLGRIDDFAAGPALVVDDSRVDVVAPGAGVVASIDARPGDALAAGQVILRLRGDERGGGGPRPGAATGGEGSLLLVRAPIAGRLGELDVRRGQSVATGKRLAAVVEPRSDLTLIALMPGPQRSLLRPGAALRVELSGDPHGHHDVVIERLGDRLLGPEEANRLLGGRASVAVGAGSYVLVRSRLPAVGYRGRGVDPGDCDGMTGTARVHVGSRPVLLAIVPGLAQLLDDHGD
ncbi:MAG TPA: HlyD family efflux transporter periplasmic adaptor subunit [Kofleriaceae bacterium]|nr:HlyD family efflux transporter periplasmic adaptor subunit [Kofleriaceae bacterium]